MTVQELYEYAFENLLLDKDVNDVIQQFNLIKSSSTFPISSVVESTDIFGDKVEYSYEDVIKLFSS